MSDGEIFDEDAVVEFIRDELAKATPSTRKRVFEKFTLAALGSIPWVGGFIGAAAALKLEKDEIETDSLQTRWLEEHAEKIERLRETINWIGQKFSDLGEEIDERIQSEEYLQIVRKGFRVWDRADTDEKRKYVANLVSNAVAIQLTFDDVIRLFIDWLDQYHEIHFAVIGQIFTRPRSTRYEIWGAIHGDVPREDSAEADLYRLLIHDLSTGRVIRQERATTAGGEYLKKTRPRRRGTASRTMESSFENTKPYVLTSLGDQFVRYTMTELVPKIGAEGDEESAG